MISLLLLLSLFTLLPSVLAAEAKSAPLFVPAVAPALVGLALYALSGIVHWIQLFRIGKPYMLPLPIGMTTMAIGFAVRILVHNSPTSLGLNIGTTLLILLSPCLFLALDYVILGRLAGLFGPEVSKKCMLIAPTRVATIFVWSDVATFLIQAIGGSMTTSSKIDTINLGNKIVLVGLGVQLASFGLFTTLMIVFGLRVRTRFPHVWRATGSADFAPFSKDPAADWHILYYTLCLSCVSILIRSIFRLAEFVQGHKGYISTHEAFFYCFDALPLWIAMTLYCSVWPPRFLNTTREAEVMELQKNLGRMYGEESASALIL
ncbi:RTA1 like protein-domain-containing protein [Mycena albidolilacea]|uniref:RTA1 like protein-domain-containing protein n=1 Tax=Mycena albidolilacea TaxID=1033008 RepID=A0AAD7AIP5_9AGAR|nr:RTA1 like protein-domain-containing protein [Mycena albidolilacea]